MSEQLYRSIKEVDLRHVLRERGVHVDSRGYARAPWRDERTPSVKVYADHFHDYGDPERRGDLLDWLELAEGMDKETAREEAERIVGIGRHNLSRMRRASLRQTPPPTVTKRGGATPTPWIAELVARAHEALVRGESEAAQRAWGYLEARRLETCVEASRLGVVDESVGVRGAGTLAKRLQGRLIVPTLEEGRPVWFKARETSGRSAEVLKSLGIAKYDGPPGRVLAPFNVDALTEAGALGFAVLTEGETDALSLLAAYGAGYPAFGLPGGLIPLGFAERLAQVGVREVVLVTDADAAGTKHAERAREALIAANLEVFVLSPPGHGDLNEMLVALGPERMVEGLESAKEEMRAGETSDLRYLREGWLAELDARATRPHAAYSTGLEALDDLLEGGYLEGLHLLGGITGGGKTSLALSIALHNALAGRPVLYASYEQSRLELWARLASRSTRLPYTAIKRGVYDSGGTETLVSSELRANEGWNELERAARYLKIVEGGDALSRTEGDHPLDSLARTAERMATASGAPPLILLDYLQRMPVPAELRIKDTRERVSSSTLPTPHCCSTTYPSLYKQP